MKSILAISDNCCWYAFGEVTKGEYCLFSRLLFRNRLLTLLLFLCIFTGFILTNWENALGLVILVPIVGFIWILEHPMTWYWVIEHSHWTCPYCRFTYNLRGDPCQRTTPCVKVFEIANQQERIPPQHQTRKTGCSKEVPQEEKNFTYYALLFFKRTIYKKDVTSAQKKYSHLFHE